MPKPKDLERLNMLKKIDLEKSNMQRRKSKEPFKKQLSRRLRDSLEFNMSFFKLKEKKHWLSLMRKFSLLNKKLIDFKLKLLMLKPKDKLLLLIESNSKRRLRMKRSELKRPRRQLSKLKLGENITKSKLLDGKLMLLKLKLKPRPKKSDLDLK